MTQKVVDQHEVLNRWREIADELAGAIESTLRDNYEDDSRFDPRELEIALRRYEEARNE